MASGVVPLASAGSSVKSAEEHIDDALSNLVMTGFYTFSPAIFHACHLVQPSGRREYEVSDVIDLLIQSGRTVDAIPLDGWRVDVGYPENREEAEARLEGSLRQSWRRRMVGECGSGHSRH